MDRPKDVIESRRLNARSRVGNYISNLKLRLFDRNRYIAPIQSTTVELFRFHSENDLQNLSSEFDLPSPSFHSEVELTVQNFEFQSNLHNQNSNSESNLIDFETPTVDETMENFRSSAPPDSSGQVPQYRAIEGVDPIRDGLAEAHARLQRLSADFQSVSRMAEDMRTEFANINARLNSQQNEIGESNRIAAAARADTHQLRANVAQHITDITAATANLLSTVRSQAEVQQTLRGEIVNQRQRIDQVESVARRWDGYNVDLAQINDSITNLRLQVDQSQQELREEVNVCQRNIQELRNRTNVVGNVQPIANLEKFFSSHTNDILKSFVDFDTKSNDSIKRFVNTTDMLWSSLEKTQPNIDRFLFKVKLKLAKCNQTFLHKIENMNWAQIKDEILRDYSVSSARDTLAQINTIKQKSGESLFEFANRCKTCCLT